MRFENLFLLTKRANFFTPAGNFPEKIVENIDPWWKRSSKFEKTEKSEKGMIRKKDIKSEKCLSNTSNSKKRPSFWTLKKIVT